MMLLFIHMLPFIMIFSSEKYVEHNEFDFGFDFTMCKVSWSCSSV
jgi:hypothetical protein